MDKLDRMADAARRAFFKSPRARSRLLPWDEAPGGTRKIWRQVVRAALSVYQTTARDEAGKSSHLATWIIIGLFALAAYGSLVITSITHTQG